MDDVYIYRFMKFRFDMLVFSSMYKSFLSLGRLHSTNLKHNNMHTVEHHQYVALFYEREECK
jgi:hypothetical protein